MKARFMIEKPDEVEATMKITMSVKKWTELRDRLSDDYPAWELSAKINDLLAQARKVFYPTIDDKSTDEQEDG